MIVNDLLAKELNMHAEHNMEAMLDIVAQAIEASESVETINRHIHMYLAWYDLFKVTEDVFHS